VKANIKNFDNKLFVLDGNGMYRRVVHTYVYINDFCSNGREMKQPLGVTCAVIGEDGEVTYGYSQVSYEDKYDKQIGLKIAVGRALTKPLLGPDDFEELPVMLNIIDGLYTVYDRAERAIARGWKEIGL
jgi:hypothetical protein